MKSPPSLSRIQKIGMSSGLDSVGIANAEIFKSTLQDLTKRKSKGLHAGMSFTYRNPERSTNPKLAMPECKSLIVGAKSYWEPSLEKSKTGSPTGRVALYARQDHYGALRVGLESIAEELVDAGYDARILIDDNALVDREAAYRAGIGWYGKNSNILIPKRGSWFVLGSVLTNAGYQPNKPLKDGCGSCTQCITSCPTDAIVSPGVLDANRCLAWLVQSEGDFPTEFRTALGDRIYGCDDCQEVCPTNKFEERLNNSFGLSSSESVISIHKIFESDDDSLLAEFGRWYIPKRDPRYLKRNALIVLGNSKMPPSSKTIKIVKKCLAGSDEMLRAHAVWTAKRLGLGKLLIGLEGDPSPSVQKELAQKVEGNTHSQGEESDLAWIG